MSCSIVMGTGLYSQLQATSSAVNGQSHISGRSAAVRRPTTTSSRRLAFHGGTAQPSRSGSRPARTPVQTPCSSRPRFRAGRPGQSAGYSALY